MAFHAACGTDAVKARTDRPVRSCHDGSLRRRHVLGEHITEATAVHPEKTGGVGLRRCTQLHGTLFAECIGCFIPFRRERRNADQCLDLSIACRRARDYCAPVGVSDEDDGPLLRFRYTRGRRNVAF
jgi:hypothetical protein